MSTSCLGELKTRGPKGPEEKVKGQSGAIYRGPLILSTKKWQRTSRWCCTLNMKALGMYFQTRFFKMAFLKPNFWPRELLLQPIKTIWTILVRDHPGTISVKFGQIPVSSSREKVVWSFPNVIQCKIVTPDQGQFWPQWYNLNDFGRGPLDDAIYQIWNLWAV